MTPLLLGLAGIALFALAFLRANLTTTAADAPIALARMEPVFGTLSVEKDGAIRNVAKNRAFQKMEMAETGPDSEALLTFPDGEQVRLLENTVVLGDLEGGKSVLIVKAGDVWVEKPGLSSDGPMISRDGVRRTLVDDQKEQMKLAATDPSIKIPVAANQAAGVPRVAKPAPSRAESLTAEYVQDVLRGQRHSFFKCYGQLLQRKPGVTGEASIAFTIEHTGKVAQAQIPDSTVQDPQFRRCLTDAVKRIEFKSFSGESMQTLFPIRFE